MNALDLVGLVGRLMFLVVFVRGGYSGSIHLSNTNTIAVVARTGAPLPSLTVPASQVLQWVGIIPVTYWTHALWRLEGQPRQVQTGNFLRNLSYLGGVLLILHAALVGALPLTVTGPLLTIR